MNEDERATLDALFELSEPAARGACDQGRSRISMNCRPEGAGYVIAYCGAASAQWLVSIHTEAATPTRCRLSAPGLDALRVHPINIESDVEVLRQPDQVVFDVVANDGAAVLEVNR